MVDIQVVKKSTYLCSNIITHSSLPELFSSQQKNNYFGP
jgi:hypothetical protein